MNIFMVFIDLPEDYHSFLLRHNGGDPEPAFFKYTRRKSGIRVSWVNRFHSITAAENDPLNFYGANLLLCRMAIHLGIPYDCITIGDTGSDDPLLLFVRGRRRGQIWIKVKSDINEDPDPERDTNPSDGLYKLANSFNEFLGKLRTEADVGGIG